MGKKTLCDLAKKLPRNSVKYAAKVNDPRFLCTRCGRVANNKVRLCRPTQL